jgi:hypothetical protein
MLYIYILYSCYVTIKEKSNINKKLIDRHASWSTTGCHWKYIYIICMPFQGNVCSLTHSNNIWRLVLSKWQVSFITSWDPWNQNNPAFDSRSSSYGKPRVSVRWSTSRVWCLCVFHDGFPMQTRFTPAANRLQPRRGPEEHDSLLVSAPGTRKGATHGHQKRGTKGTWQFIESQKLVNKNVMFFHNRCIICIKRFRKASVDQCWLGFYQIRHFRGCCL